MLIEIFSSQKNLNKKTPDLQLHFTHLMTQVSVFQPNWFFQMSQKLHLLQGFFQVHLLTSVFHEGLSFMVICHETMHQHSGPLQLGVHMGCCKALGSRGNAPGSFGYFTEPSFHTFQSWNNSKQEVCNGPTISRRWHHGCQYFWLQALWKPGKCILLDFSLSQI